MSMTQKQAREICKANGYSFRRTSAGDYRAALLDTPRRAAEESAIYCDTLEDLVATVQAESKRAEQQHQDADAGLKPQAEDIAETVTLLPVGMETPEGIRRVNATAEKLEQAKQKMAWRRRSSSSPSTTMASTRTAATAPTAKTRELVHEFLTPAQDEWRNCSHEFLRAIAGR